MGGGGLSFTWLADVTYQWAAAFASILGKPFTLALVSRVSQVESRYSAQWDCIDQAVSRAYFFRGRSVQREDHVIEAVRVGPLRALPQTALHSLGRINVICGQNNSGKSTVLEALNEASTRDDGLHLLEPRLELLARAAIAASAQRAHEPYQHAISDIVKSAANDHPESLWYRSQTQEFVAQCQNRGRENRFVQSFGWNLPELANRFNSLFGPLPVAALLPSKRRLEESTQLDPSQGLLRDGVGLVNYLFYGLSRIYDHDNKLVSLILETFTEITGGVQARPEIDRDRTLRLMFRAPDQSWVPAENAGVGFQSLLHLLYVALEPVSALALIEEPENHLHPEMQRRFMRFLRDNTTKQFFLSTHSNVFLSDYNADQVFLTQATPTIAVKNVTSRAAALRDLGYTVSDNLRADLIILVEGPHDKPLIERFLDQLGITDRFTIKLWPMSGDNMAHVDLETFREDSHIIALIDRDPANETIRAAFQERCRQLQVPCHRLERYAIENYFTVDALRAVFADKVPPDFLAINPDVSLEKQLGFKVKRRNDAISEHMSLKDIEGSDLAAFLEIVRRRCETL